MRPDRTPRLLMTLAVIALAAAGCGDAEEIEPTATDSPTAEVTAPVATDTETEPVATDTETEPVATDTEPESVTTETATDAIGAETEAEPAVTDTEPGAAEGADEDILGMASEIPDFSQLNQAIEAAGLQDALTDVGPITVFAPTNEAFSTVDQDTLSSLLADPSQLDDILQYHIVEGELLESDLTDGTTLDTLAGESLDVSVDGDTIMVDGATVTTGPAQAANGVLYGIDEILMPPGA